MHVDFAGPLFGKTYLLVVDRYSKWPEIWEVSSMSTMATIEVLRHIFSVFGLPEQLVSDNGQQFTSNEFVIFLSSNGIKHFKSAPYHLSTNGAVERGVQTLKNSLKKGKKEGHTSQYTLLNFLLFYRATPHSTTGKPPSELMLKRLLRIVLGLLKPNTETKVRNQQGLQKSNHDTYSQFRQLEVGQEVMVRSYCDIDPSWISEKLWRRRVMLRFLMKLKTGAFGNIVDQLLSKGQSTELDDTWEYPSHVTFPEPQSQLDQNTGPNRSCSESETINLDDCSTNTTRCYPQRVCNPPNRYF